MNDLITWLRGVLDEDDASTQRALALLGVPDPRPHPGLSDAGNQALHDFERKAADIAAKRAILDEHPAVDGIAWDATGNEQQFGAKVCGTCSGVDYRDTEQPIGDPYPCRTVRLLASAYADRPGYREERRP